MGVPVGGAGGGGQQIPPVETENRDPRRARPEGVPITEFLIGIGRQHRDKGEQYTVLGQYEEQQVSMALALNDIIQVGTTEPREPVEGEGAAARDDFPIYQFVGSDDKDPLKFTLDPNVKDVVEPSFPPDIPHEPGQVHHGMEAALWAGFCYDNPTERNPADYHDLWLGMRVRYSGDNQLPQ